MSPRRGEAASLSRREVNELAKTIGINWQIVQLDWQPIQGKPKTDASDRTIAMDAGSVAALRHHAPNRPKNNSPPVRTGLIAGSSPPANSDTHCTPSTSPTSSTGSPTKQDCHRSASTMLAAGVKPKIVQETLGHVSTSFTRDTYTGTDFSDLE
ncbi:site-specific integrase [Spongiactinospora rosea]|uniref:hypothetical protein n=1 Tax=Spongiactinospora rosea TaxID=2248750 RepID=UPI0011C02C57|nr:hypothetical protein [Spongiactinospora rosea]